MEKRYQVEIVGRVCILNEIIEHSGDGGLLVGVESTRLAAGTPKMVGDAIRISLTNAIGSGTPKPESTEPTESKPMSGGL